MASSLADSFRYPSSLFRSSVEAYYQVHPHTSTSTSSTLTNNNLRLSPAWIGSTIKITRIGAEVTVTGDVGSTMRFGIYADNGDFYPGALVRDFGAYTIAGDSATVQEAILQTPDLQILQPGLYWIGGALQGAPSSQPTFRTAASPNIVGGANIPSAAGSVLGFAQASVSGALPATFSTSVVSSGNMPRIFWKAIALTS